MDNPKYTNGWANENKGKHMRENADNVDQVRDEIGVIFSYIKLLDGEIRIESFKSYDKTTRIRVSFGNEPRLNMSIEKFNELIIKGGFVLQDLESEERNGKV